MARKKIAIVGAGAKAAAIAAKAYCLNEIRGSDIEVTVFERGSPGQNWKGGAGYTDGEQLVCTPVERDLGFSYESVYGSRVNDLMQARFSWLAHSVSRNDFGYLDRVNRGMQRIPHREFADYITFAISRSNAQIEAGFAVSSLAPVRGKWQINREAHGREIGYASLFDAVVMTGPGPARDSFQGKTDAAVFNAQTVWSNRAPILAALGASREPIVIAGGGGAAAAVAAWLAAIDPVPRRAIVIIAGQATFYVRSGGYFENRVFDDDDLWSRLGLPQQQEFVDRVTRAVVWGAVADQLMRSNRILLEPGYATDFHRQPAPRGPDEFWVEFLPVTKFAKTTMIEASVLIDAAGFDPWWFHSLLPATTEAAVKSAAADMDFNLRLPLAGLPALHAPGVSQAQSPAFTSLMLLGRMSDRILQPYV